MTERTSFAVRLKAARYRRDMSATQLCLRTGLKQSHISHFEIGSRQPSADNLRKLALALDITADYLLGLSNESRRIQ